jgi:1-acyl-sn-glycerol-3-phosphate acyltransferase
VRWEAIVADAEVIPLGTRGRPGRGTGSRKPSAAARNLAGSAKPAKPAKGTSTGSAKPRRKARPDTRSPEPPGEQPTTPDVPEQPTAAGADGEADDHAAGSAVGRETSGTTATDRAPGAGIPVSDWLDAFSTASREVFGEQWEPRLAELLAFTRRRITGEYRVDEYGFDREVTERFFIAAFRPIAEKWFRVEARGVENIPTEGGALVVSNHSGTVPLDGLMTAVTLHDQTGRNLRPLGADLVFRLPIVGEMARKAGATLACNDDAERMLCGGELVGVWPEGFKGIGKPYSERYKLQRFGRGGFVSAAMRTGVPIVPCSVVGAEEIYPLVGNIPSLARLLGVPYIPITPFFPLLGPLGMVPLPSKWLIEFGEPIRTDSYDQGAADDPMLVFNVTDQVRETIQQTLYTLLMQRRSVFY